MSRKIALIILIAVLMTGFFQFDLPQYFSLNFIKVRQQAFADYYASHVVATLLGFFGAYVGVTALSLPGAAVMTVLAGALFGLETGVIVVSCASTLGATLAFLVSRYLLRERLEARYAERLQLINAGLAQEGAFYLFALRLVPLFPFVLINLLMGVTRLPVLTFAWVSQLGMLAGTIAYVYAGTRLGQLDSLAGILSPGLLSAFAVLGLLPLLTRRVLAQLCARRVYRGFNRPRRFAYNLIVIGAGAGGLVAAYIAAATRASVVLIEKQAMGGDCLNSGCVPSKALIRAAKALHAVRTADTYGIRTRVPEVDFPAVMARVREVIRSIAPHDSVERYTALGVTFIQGEAQVLDPWRVRVNGQTLTARSLVLATGAHPQVPAIPGLEQVPYLTSETVWGLEALPPSLLVLGGGPVGCELAQAFARLGSRVTLVEREPRLLVREDVAVSRRIQAHFEAEGMTVLTGHHARAFGRDQEGYWLHCAHQDGTRRIVFGQVLLALGRRARVTGFGLESLGLALRDNGTLQADAFLATRFPNIFVAGDVTGPYQFTHVAAHQAWYASVNALFGLLHRFRVDERVLPQVTFTDPEVARVGLNEQEAQAQGIPYELTVYELAELDRAIVDGNAEGVVRVLTVPGRDRILGATLVGQGAGELLNEFVLAMKWKLGLNKLLATLRPYPTLSEAGRYAAGNWKRAHAPERLLVWVARFHAWRRGAE